MLIFREYDGAAVGLDHARLLIRALERIGRGGFGRFFGRFGGRLRAMMACGERR